MTTVEPIFERVQQRPLPAGWRGEHLGAVCDEHIASVDPSREPDRSFRYIDISSVDAGTKRIVDARELTGRDAPLRARQAVRAHDVLVATTRPNLNAVALVPPELDGAIASTGFCVLRAGPDVLPEFVFYFVRWPAFVDALTNLTKGAMYPAVTDGQVRSQLIPLPPPPEQQRIAAVLKEQMAAVDQARAACEARLEAARALPWACLRQVFGNLPSLASSPVVPKAPSQPGWAWHRLTSLSRLATGHTPSRYRPEYWTGDVPWLQLADIRSLDGHEALDTSEHTNALGIGNSSAVLLPKGTVCLSRTASVGFVTIMGRPMATSQDFVNWVCGAALDPWFLMLLLLANRRRIVDLGSGAVHRTIYFPAVESFSVCIPPKPEQERTAAVLLAQIRTAEAALKSAEDELESIEALPASLLRRAFTGGV